MTLNSLKPNYLKKLAKTPQMCSKKIFKLNLTKLRSQIYSKINENRAQPREMSDKKTPFNSEYCQNLPKCWISTVKESSVYTSTNYTT